MVNFLTLVVTDNQFCSYIAFFQQCATWIRICDIAALKCTSEKSKGKGQNIPL